MASVSFYISSSIVNQSSSDIHPLYDSFLLDGCPNELLDEYQLTSTNPLKIRQIYIISHNDDNSVCLQHSGPILNSIHGYTSWGNYQARDKAIAIADTTQHGITIMNGSSEDCFSGIQVLTQSEFKNPKISINVVKENCILLSLAW